LGGPGFVGTGFGGGFPGVAPPPPKVDKALSSVKVTLPEKNLVVITVALLDPAANSEIMNSIARPLVLKQKGSLDVAVTQPRIHELAAATRAYQESHQAQFPRGTIERTIPSTRAGRPYPPDERVSWLAELLLYMQPEQQTLAKGINRQKSWRDPENLLFAS